MNDIKGQKSTTNSIRHMEHGITDKAIFSGDAISTFAYKKTEKLSSAIHLVTNVVPEHEPLRRHLRKKSLVILSEIVSLKTMPHTIGQTVGTPLATVGELVALLEIARAAGYISSMNAEILDREYRVLGSVLERHTGDIAGKSVGFAPDFLHVPLPVVTENTFSHHSKGMSGKEDKGQIKGQTKVSSRTTNKRLSSTSSQTISKGQNGNRHTERRDTIYTLLKERTNVSVKDVAEVAKNCSEKTIQRELATLVHEGILKKEGERRWSTYSLA